MKKLKKIIGNILIGLAFFVMAFGFFLICMLFSPWEGPTYRDTKDFIKKDKANFEHIFTRTFDKAKSCNDLPASSSAEMKCKREVSSEIYNKLQHIKDLDQDESTYFIRLNDKKEIEKMFLDGKFNVQNPAIASEKWCKYALPKNCDDKEFILKQQQKVVELLEGEYSHLPRYYSSWDSIMQEIKRNPELFFLKDLGSEVDSIFLVQTNDKNLGAVVKLYGD